MTVRAKLSEKNRYFVEKHRYYELKHFCLQYPIWKKEYMDLDGYGSKPTDLIFSKVDTPGDPTSRLAELRLVYFDKMKLVERAAMDADRELADYILRGVTEGLSYATLKARFDIPCGKDMYYDRYRRFFWLLDRTRY